MATGFTYNAGEKDNFSFREFALKFSELEPGKPPVLREEDCSYHTEQLAKDRAELKRVLAWTPEEADREAEKNYEEMCTHEYQMQLSREQKRSRYEIMIEKVKAWNPPHRELLKTKKFMLEQLEGSIEHDCEGMDRSVPKWTGEQFKAQRIQWTQDSIKYHLKHRRADKKRLKKRNDLVQMFYESVMACED